MSATTHRSTTLAAGLALAIALTGLAPAGAGWQVDTAHSEVGFSVNHFFTPVNGNFNEFDIDLVFDSDNPSASSVHVAIPVTSVNTGNDRRDGHLRSADFFGVEEHPILSFQSSSVRAGDDGQWIATGELTMKGVSKTIELPITLLGIKEIPEEMQQMLGGAKRIASFRANTTLDRGDFGVGTGNWAATLVVGGEVDVEVLIEAHWR